ncbi:MAG TPA: gamma-glutamyl-gamma-aminobutyrate hydrolase family protein [Burkholderiales bacterium]|nr:gamma-glutamyl-gamma-aminobutyrate hydrolase family protein [Burkholderiales bacterium]
MNIGPESIAPMPRRQNPLIGLTTYGRGADNRYTLPAEYLDAVRRAGGVPVLIAPGESRVEAILEVIDALILSGGGDIDPSRYNGKRHETNYAIDQERDTHELELGRRAIDMGKPTLGICRGAQILNVVQGGTLIEHIPDEFGESVLHRAPPREPVTHGVKIKTGSRLAKILGLDQFDATSWHHQALRGAAAGFEAVAHAPDGSIEAIEMPGHPWLIAVQWHPELSAASDPVQQKLFDAIVEQARK